ncbi:hypothetical protein SLEP1_g7659 [Rubroshorea leprosula]|uniref:Uncharacterized protein n=1 Tax=Rubroshorea leprosula TaxID=152421 RepID=A0AAV5I935_9ROSI|nr:hypothetical protein SLEP1_g7659 [Rubroshorea leprosula]
MTSYLSLYRFTIAACARSWWWVTKYGSVLESSASAVQFLPFGTTITWREATGGIAISAKRPWLILGDPMFHSITKFPEAKLRMVSKIIPDGLKKPPHSSSKAWGTSQWKMVTNA